MTLTDLLPIVSVSGGKDSTALYCLAQEEFGNNFRAVFADTGHEHPVTVNYVKNLHVMANGPIVEIVKADFSSVLTEKGKEATGNPFEDMLLWKGRAPSAAAQFCTEWVKLWPIREWLRTLDQEPLLLTGIRGAESARRAAMQPFSFHSYHDGAWTMLPLLYETEDKVWEIMREHDVPPNPLYEAGYSRVGCYPCIYAQKVELARLEPWAWEKLRRWEELMGRTWFPPETVPYSKRQRDAIKAVAEYEWVTIRNKKTGRKERKRVLTAESKPKVLALKIEYLNTLDDVRRWAKTTRGGRQFGLYAPQSTDVPSCMSTWGVCE